MSDALENALAERERLVEKQARIATEIGKIDVYIELYPRFNGDDHIKPSNRLRPIETEPGVSLLVVQPVPERVSSFEAAPDTGESAAPHSDEPEQVKSVAEEITSEAPQVQPSEPIKAPKEISAPMSKKEMVRRCHVENPDWTAAKIASDLGLTAGSVSGHLFALGIKLSEARQKKVEKPEAPAPRPAAPIIVGPVKRPHGTQFRLREKLGMGKFLHDACETLTDDKTYAWSGDEAKLLACRKKYPLAATLVEEVIA